MQAEGKATSKFMHVDKVIKHDYLRESIEHRVERKNLFTQFKA